MLLKKLPLLNAAIALVTLAAGLLAVEPKLPRPLADVSIDLPGAKRIRLIDTKPGAKLRIVALLAGFCDHCAETATTLTKLERKYRARGLKVYGALVDEDAAQQLPKFTAKNKPSYPVGTLTPDSTRRVAGFGQNDRPFVPILLFVDNSNQVRLQLFGDNPIMSAGTEATLTNIIEGLLKGK